MKRLCLVLLAAASIVCAESYDAKMFGEMHWRSIGPLRGGRTRASAGVAGQPNVFYIGAVNGGVWKTNDYGRTWTPIFDDQPTGSIGAIAIAPSDPNIIYVGSGEGLQRPDLSVGDGIYKSTDAGKTWTHLGLRNGQQIPQIVIDPRDPNRLFVAVLGHPYGPNEERGIFRSTDGGQTFEKVLYKDENTGANDVELDPSNPDTVYAAMWEARQGPWENGAWSGTGGGIFKSTDGGKTWRQLTKGLPEEGVVQANIAIAPSDPKRLYSALATSRGTAIYRSDDAGENWSQATTDARPAARIGGGDCPMLAVDPKNSEIVYSASVVTWKSTDAGKTWTGIRGAPGGDDYQKIWINPEHPSIFLITGDQGAIITVNGGDTWSSWYNQSTAQMYHAAADNAFPYRVCGGQQESGSACVASRGNDGEITFREWHPVGVEEYGYAAPDPLDPDLVYGGKLTRFDRRTGQVENIAPKPIRAGDFRALRTAPVMFSPIDPHVLYFAANTVWKTRDGGRNWQEISPDLTRKTWEAPANIGKYRDTPTAKPSQRGVIYALAPSPLDINRIWAGTDDGLIHVTVDGGVHWQDVTPPRLVPFAKVSILDAGHFDAQTAYAAINTLRLDEMRPHILRTHDGGKTWNEIVSGIPDGAPVDVVREDPKHKGLLYAGTERQVYVSFDDGDHWQSLRLNMPATSIRDLIIKDDDVIVATHSRGFWILDNVTPLRQLTPAVADAEAFLFKPEAAIRVRWDMNTDTPVPPDEPAGQNPPDGAILDYTLGPSASGTVTLEISDSAGKLVRRYSSDDPVERVDLNTLAIPAYWVRPAHTLSSAPGMHRFLWDMRFAPVREGRPNYGMQAIYHDTPASNEAPWVMPGAYAVRLTVNGKSYAQQLEVKMDPRVRTPVADLTQQFALSKQLYDDILVASKSMEEAGSLRKQMAQLRERAGQGASADALEAFDKKIAAIAGGGGRGGGRFAPSGGPDTLASVQGALSGLLRIIQGADVAPTPQVAAASEDRRKALAALMERWRSLKQDAAGLPELKQ
ncbi:MAG TPA: glycoside hydrolase [Bryobacteraceae bacterium]|nr:glycoside hydrolase [Bryobacteraceae bacterium]